MGLIYTLILGELAMLAVWRLFPAGAATPMGRLASGAAIGAIVVAWIVGSLLRQASFVQNPPGPMTLLAALIGGGIGAIIAAVTNRAEA